MRTHEFDALVRKSHDYLYANAEIKTPEALQAEIAKLVMVLVSQAEGGIVSQLSSKKDVAKWVRSSYEKLRKIKSGWDWGAIELDDSSIQWVLDTLVDVDFKDAKRDFLGDALEVMRSTDAKRLGGQFFTDQRVTELTLKLLNYNPEVHDFLDICAGTGGFLIPAVKRSSSASKPQSIYGVEIDPKISRLAQSTLLHIDSGIGARVFQADSLKSAGDWSLEMRKRVIPGTHLRLASNPPFGTKIKIRDTNVLQQFELARQWRRVDHRWMQLNTTTARAPELLFIERNLQLALPGEGVIGLILPYQILSGPQLGFVRQWLLMNAQMIAVVDLPADTFQPWTGTKTSIVIFKRRSSPLTEVAEIAKDPKIFMAVSQHIGHDRRGNPIVDEEGEIKQDLEQVGKAFAAHLVGHKVTNLHSEAFLVHPEDLLASSDNRLNAAHYRPSGSNLHLRFSSPNSRGFTSKPLGELVDKVFCPGRFKRNYVEQGGVPFLGGSNISQFSITTSKALSKGDPHLEELLVKEDWILVTRSGSTGIVSRVPRAWDGFAVSEHVIRIVPKMNEVAITNYIETFLRSKWGQELLAMGVFGSVIDEITPDFIANLPIPLPKNAAKLDLLSRYASEVGKGRDKVAEGLSASQNELMKLLKGVATG
jgi:type I restriction enzyme M protein